MTSQADLRRAALERGEPVYAGSKCYTCGYRVRNTRTARCATCERRDDAMRREELRVRLAEDSRLVP